MKNIYQTYLSLINNQIFNAKYSGSLVIEDNDANDLFSICKLHDTFSIVYSGLVKNNVAVSKSVLALFETQSNTDAFRFTKQIYTADKVCELFEKENIRYIKLKGLKIKPLYPKPYFRTSCDIDILIDKQNVKRAKELITKNLGYTLTSTGIHDCAFEDKNGTHIEIHFCLLENERLMDKTLKNAWDYARPLKNNEYEFTKEFFMFYFIAHTAHHFKLGGVGVRQIVDVKVLLGSIKFDDKKLFELLSGAGLTSFYNEITRLSSLWFDGETPIIEGDLSSYVLSTGAYGIKEEIIANKLATTKKGKYFLKRIFFPYKNMTMIYPILKYLPILLPFFWAHRLMVKLFTKKAVKELKTVSQTSKETLQKRKELFEKLNLK